MAPMQIPQYALFETLVRLAARAPEPSPVELGAVFSPPAGAPRLRVPLYYDGDRTYRLRFSPETPGAWTWAIEPPAGVALDGHPSGAFDVTPSTARGPLRRAPEPHHFRYAGGERPFVLGATAYNLIACYQRAPEEARAFVEHYARRGFNWVRFFLQQSTWDSHGRVVWPWGGSPEAPDFGAFDPATFRAAEAVVRLLAGAGCTASVILLHPCDPVFRRRDDLIPVFRRYFREAVARLGAYANVVWNVANEWERGFVLEARQLETLGAFLEQIDPYGRLTSVHHYGRFEFPDRPWTDMASMQHRGLPHEINRVAVANRAFGKPVLNEEYGYEGDDHSPPNDPASVRHDHWALTLAGAYGTYGDKTKGPKIGAYFSSTLEDSAGAVAPNSLRHLPALMGRTRWWEMTPLNELLSGCRREEVFCLARPGQAYLVYMTTGQDVSLDLSHVTSGTLRAEWWNPRTGEAGPAFDRPRFESGRKWGAASVREPVTFTPPDHEHDWALYLTAHPT